TIRSLIVSLVASSKRRSSAKPPVSRQESEFRPPAVQNANRRHSFSQRRAKHIVPVRCRRPSIGTARTTVPVRKFPDRYREIEHARFVPLPTHQSAAPEASIPAQRGGGSAQG